MMPMSCPIPSTAARPASSAAHPAATSIPSASTAAALLRASPKAMPRVTLHSPARSTSRVMFATVGAAESTVAWTGASAAPATPAPSAGPPAIPTHLEAVGHTFGPRKIAAHAAASALRVSDAPMTATASTVRRATPRVVPDAARTSAPTVRTAGCADGSAGPRRSATPGGAAHVLPARRSAEAPASTSRPTTRTAAPVVTNAISSTDASLEPASRVPVPPTPIVAAPVGCASPCSMIRTTVARARRPVRTRTSAVKAPASRARQGSRAVTVAGTAGPGSWTIRTTAAPVHIGARTRRSATRGLASHARQGPLAVTEVRPAALRSSTIRTTAAPVHIGARTRRFATRGLASHARPGPLAVTEVRPAALRSSTIRTTAAPAAPFVGTTAGRAVPATDRHVWAHASRALRPVPLGFHAGRSWRSTTPTAAPVVMPVTAPRGASAGSASRSTSVSSRRCRPRSSAGGGLASAGSEHLVSTACGFSSAPIVRARMSSRRRISSSMSSARRPCCLPACTSGGSSRVAAPSWPRIHRPSGNSSCRLSTAPGGSSTMSATWTVTASPTGSRTRTNRINGC